MTLNYEMTDKTLSAFDIYESHMLVVQSGTRQPMQPCEITYCNRLDRCEKGVPFVS
jgi:hypothetical protein